MKDTTKGDGGDNKRVRPFPLYIKPHIEECRNEMEPVLPFKHHCQPYNHGATSHC